MANDGLLADFINGIMDIMVWFFASFAEIIENTWVVFLWKIV